ncbi:MAG: hypothetical protein V3T31_06915 [candidate division Zixibacteria bacterium]
MNALSEASIDRLAKSGYWPARAAKLLAAGEFANSVEVCRQGVKISPVSLAGRAIYGQALYYAGQTQQAAEQFYLLMSLDADNQVALKFLGDIQFEQSNSIAAVACYERLLQLDPDCDGLYCSVERKTSEITRAVTLIRPAEEAEDEPPLRKIPFLTETIGDLYSEQGHHKLAAEVYRRLTGNSSNPRLTDKLDRAEKAISRKEL